MFPFAKLRFEIELLDDNAPAGFWGSALRGGYGDALIAAHCHHPPLDDYQTCERFATCPYPFLFESIRAARGVFTPGLPVGNDSNVPVPYVIAAPRFTRNPSRGEQISFTFTAFGAACARMETTVQAFAHFGAHSGITGANKRPARFCIRDVLDLNDGGRSIYGGGRLNSLISCDIAEAVDTIHSDHLPRELTIEFLTPVNLKLDGAPRRDRATGLTIFSDFYDLISSLTIRIGKLWQLYGAADWVGGREYIARVRRIKDLGKAASNLVQTRDVDLQMFKDETGSDLARYSSRQRTRQTLAGFVGNMTFAGDLRDFWHLLRIGEITHLGNNTANGLGRYRLIY